MKKKAFIIGVVGLVVIVFALNLNVFVMQNFIKTYTYTELEYRGYTTQDISEIKITHSYLNLILSYDEWIIEVEFKKEPDIYFKFSYRDNKIIFEGVSSDFLLDKEDILDYSERFKNGTLLDIPQTLIIESDKDALDIVNIIDRTKTEGLPYDMAEEKFFEDGDNEYYFSGIYSHYVIVHYGDGSQEDIVTALNTGKAIISDLDKFGVSYTVKPSGTRSAELPNNPISQTEAEEAEMR